MKEEVYIQIDQKAIEEHTSLPEEENCKNNVFPDTEKNNDDVGEVEITAETNCCLSFFTSNQKRYCSRTSYFRQCFCIVTEAALYILGVSALIGFPTAMFTYGVFHLNDCSGDPSLPVLLIIGGLLIILKIFIVTIRVTPCILNRDEHDWCRFPDTILSVLFFLWFFADTIWLINQKFPYALYFQPSKCTPEMSNFSFSATLLIHIFLLVVLAFCLVRHFKARARDAEESR